MFFVLLVYSFHEYSVTSILQGKTILMHVVTVHVIYIIIVCYMYIYLLCIQN